MIAIEITNRINTPLNRTIRNTMNPIIETNLGKIRGIQKEEYQEFLGIRYAKSPTENLRYKEPEPVDSWEDVYDATDFGPIAYQQWVDNPSIDMEESEDCLFLNVCTPQADGEKRPVMVYIHGGGFGIGSGSRPRLHGHRLVTRGNIVLVTIQYRLSMLGFLSMDNIPPNLGILDQICALKWVRNNIANFGGDPENITIFGQSAGASSVLFLLTQPKAEGLFHKAISQSGVLLSSSPTETNDELSREILSKLKVEYGNLDALQKLPIEKLTQVMKKLGDMMSGKMLTPIQEGDLYTQLEEGFSKDVPLLMGYTSDEMPIFQKILPSLGKAKGFLGRQFIKRNLSKITSNGSTAPLAEFHKNRLKDTGAPKDAEYDYVILDTMFRIPTIKIAETRSKFEVGTFIYEFEYEAPNIQAAIHVLDLFFVFGTIDTADISKEMQLAQSTDEQRLSEIMMDAWSNFARTGNPSITEIQWPEFNMENYEAMILNVTPRVKKEYLKNERSFWSEIS